jgi:hypothetical protein
MKLYGGWTPEHLQVKYLGRCNLPVARRINGVFHTEPNSHVHSDPSKSRTRVAIYTSVAVAHYHFQARLPFEETKYIFMGITFCKVPGSGINPQGGSRGSSSFTISVMTDQADWAQWAVTVNGGAYQDRAGPGWAGPFRFGRDKAGPGRARADRSGRGRAGAGLVWQGRFNGSGSAASRCGPGPGQSRSLARHDDHRDSKPTFREHRSRSGSVDSC